MMMRKKEDSSSSSTPSLHTLRRKKMRWYEEEDERWWFGKKWGERILLKNPSHELKCIIIRKGNGMRSLSLSLFITHHSLLYWRHPFDDSADDDDHRDFNSDLEVKTWNKRALMILINEISADDNSDYESDDSGHHDETWSRTFISIEYDFCSFSVWRWSTPFLFLIMSHTYLTLKKSVGRPGVQTPIPE